MHIYNELNQKNAYTTNIQMSML